MRHPLAAPPVLNHVWALDFMTDTLYDGRRFRTLNILDEGNREGPAITVGTSLPSVRVIAILGELVALHGKPTALRMDNGPEFISRVITSWCRRARRHHALHPARQAAAERLHRALQQELPRGSVRGRVERRMRS